MYRKFLVLLTSVILFPLSYLTGALISSEHHDDEVIVAVLDSGVDYTHAKLSGNVLNGFDFVEFDEDPIDVHGHGTHITGLIINEAPDSKILPVRILDENNTAYGLSCIAIPYAIINGADVINMSYSETPNPLTYMFIKIGQMKGVIFVAATGNDALEDKIVYPAKYKEVISVSAINANTSKLYAYANISNDTNLLAPGVNVRSTGLNNKEIYKSGTSMAAATVSGLIAKKLQIDPHMSDEEMLSYLEGSKIGLYEGGQPVLLPHKLHAKK
ncbi:S8 family peptidase [Radiobacillus sp. PE A8.2]|uniref:S8 family peptidase n=1 Tax=Radiobacillus sp. PE A8.2 TaxID=3380349 RepID=UPI00388D2D46